MDPEEIRRLIRVALPDAQVELEDLTGGQDHWKAEVTSARFEGKTSIACHRMVYAALGDYVGGQIPALALETRVPEA